MSATLTRSEERTAYLLLVAMAICFGGTWVAGAWAVDEMPPFSIAAMRFGTGALLLFAWTRLGGRAVSPLQLRDLPLIAGMGLTAIAGYNWLFLTGLTLAPASDGAIIVPGSVPIMTALLAAIVLGERIGRRGLLGILLAGGGLLLVIGPTAEGSDTRLAGDLMFLAGGVLWAVYNVLARVASRRFNAVSAALYGMAAGTLFLLPGAIVEGAEATLASASAQAWLGVGYLAVFGSVLAFVFLQMGVARIGSSRASTFALLVPVFGVLLSVILLGDQASPYTFVGGAIVVGGVWLVQTHPAGPQAEPAAAPD
jgi:drug/metabolite transporter (DMT)-like permease